MGLFGKSRSWGISERPGRWDTSGMDEAEDTGFFATGKPRGMDWLGLALGAVGDAFAQNSGGQAYITPLAMRSIFGAREARQAARDKQSTVEALIARGIPESEAVILAGDRQKTSDILGDKYKFQKPDQPYRFEDNAGNQWELGPDGAPKRIFTDKSPKMFYQDGQVVSVPNAYANDLGTELPPGWQIETPTIQNTAPPQLGASGLPTMLTPQQYQAVVEAKGKAATDAWLARNNIRVGGQ